MMANELFTRRISVKPPGKSSCQDLDQFLNEIRLEKKTWKNGSS